jgi:hypothetical protein
MPLLRGPAAQEVEGEVSYAPKLGGGRKARVEVDVTRSRRKRQQSWVLGFSVPRLVAVSTR